MPPSSKTFLVHPRDATESTYPLTALDCLQAAMPSIAFCLFYDELVDVTRFRSALELSLSSFPCLAGRIIRTSNKKVAPLRVKVHPPPEKWGGAQLVVTTLAKPYESKNDRRWFPLYSGPAFPCPHEPNVTYGPLLRIKLTQIACTSSSVISFGFCHAVMDVTSVGAFLQTLSSSYASLSDSSTESGGSSTADSHHKIPTTTMSMNRVVPDLHEAPASGPLEQFSVSKLIQSIPKLLKATALAKTIDLTVDCSELQRLKREFVAQLEGELEWISTYEMVGVVLLRAFYLASKKQLETQQPLPEHVTALQCRCVVDPRKRSANPYVDESHQGNVSEMPSIMMSLDNLRDDQAWQKKCLHEFHSQLRASLEDTDKMTHILRMAQASLAEGHLHTKNGRMLSSLLFAKNILEDHVTSYNSWLHIDWFGSATFGTAVPQHLQVSPGMNCLDMFWVFPKTKDQVTIRTTLPPSKVKRFLEVLTSMNVTYEVQ